MIFLIGNKVLNDNPLTCLHSLKVSASGRNSRPALDYIALFTNYKISENPS